MPGPKYGEFTYPKSFGFTGSAGAVSVNGHTRKSPQRFAEGGRVEKDKPKAKPPIADTVPNPKPDPKISALDALRGKGRREKEKELGLKKGGKAKKYADGGRVNSSSVAREPEQSNAMDQETGGRGPLRPGYAKGGIRRPGRSALQESAMLEKKLKRTPVMTDASKTIRRLGELNETMGASKRRKIPYAVGGPVKAKTGGGATAIAAKAIKKHVAAPKPRGHGVGKMKGGRAAC